MSIITISITSESTLYPVLLKNLKDKPSRLFIKYDSNYTDLMSSKSFDNCLSIVGSRNATLYGKRVVKYIVSNLISSRVIIVSGFMYGIDVQSHLEALKAGLRTIAVMPCGIDYIYPNDQRELYFSILSSGGFIVSEYSGEFPAKNWTFVRRNRIVAGLSRALIIVEAGVNSGSLITANYAKKYIREIFAVPGEIFSENSKGIYQIINAGAKMMTSYFDIKEFYNVTDTKSACEDRFGSFGFNPFEKNTTNNVGNNLSDKIVKILKRESLPADDISQKLDLPISNTISVLTKLVICGFIKEMDGLYYVD